MTEKISKVRTLLSTDLLSTLLNNADHELLVPHKVEIQKTIGTALFKLGMGITQPHYQANPLTMEQKIARGLATEEEIAEHTASLIDSI